MCANRSSSGGAIGRSGSGRLRRRPARWEGPPVGGGVLSRLPVAEVSDSTASVDSYASQSPPPPPIDAVRDAREAARIARETGTGPADAVKLFLEAQRKLVSRVAASHKAQHAYLKKAMRKTRQPHHRTGPHRRRCGAKCVQRPAWKERRAMVNVSMPETRPPSPWTPILPRRCATPLLCTPPQIYSSVSRLPGIV